ncbi:Maf family protein [Pelovirga terrestris]|uniref:dTTP/UTP pyrophosphatase n=1 Tax=Pelovirga terrestris TaxID=2771352 RepID=A0A8J6QNP9_9BACT|nr:Maf family protein [Pelovirga terrestris]MBD1399761.1 septum formation inhibitor Maf [Pelovirga terrestris]
MDDTLVLASASPRRKELLAQIGLEFSVRPSSVAETIKPAETPGDLVIRLSLDKARDIAGRSDISARWVIGSDTVVVCDGQILGKPADHQEAAAMLRQLSGISHQVVSGYAVIDRRQQIERTEAVSTKVHFRQLTEAEIARYVATGEPIDKAGAYAIQGIAACFVSGIEGSYTNVVGLPLCRLTLALKELGVPLVI